MASAQLVGEYIIELASPSEKNKVRLVYTNSVAGPGGSPDGVIANTPEKWMKVPISLGPGGRAFGPGSKLRVIYKGAAGTTDASDSRIVFPIFNHVTGQVEFTTAEADNSAYWTGKVAADEAYLADRETVYCERILAEGEKKSLGGGSMFVSIENNA